MEAIQVSRKTHKREDLLSGFRSSFEYQDAPVGLGQSLLHHEAHHSFAAIVSKGVLGLFSISVSCKKYRGRYRISESTSKGNAFSLSKCKISTAFPYHRSEP